MYEPKTIWQCDIPWEPHIPTKSRSESLRENYQQVLTFVREHQGCLSLDVAKHMNDDETHLRKVLCRMREKGFLRSHRVEGKNFLRWEVA